MKDLLECDFIIDDLIYHFIISDLKIIYFVKVLLQLLCHSRSGDFETFPEQR